MHPPLLPTPPQGAHESARGISRVLSGHRLARIGLRRLGQARVVSALSELRVVASSHEAAFAATVAAEVARRSGDLRGAAALHKDAAEQWREAGNASLSAVALALSVEDAVLSGELQSAQANLRDVEAAGGSVHVANAFLSFARGDTAAARASFKVLMDAAPGDAWAACWVDAYGAEVLVEMGALVGAQQALDRLGGRLSPEHRFSEAFLRHAVLRARHESLRRLTLGGDEDDEKAKLHALVVRAQRYAQGFPLYRAWAHQVAGEEALLNAGDPAALFDKAIADAEEAGSPYLHGRLLARQVESMRAVQERRSNPRALRARSLLLDSGATGFLGALTTSKGGAPERMPSRMSIALRLETSLDQMNLSDEAGLDAVIEVSRHLQSVRSLDELLERIVDSVSRVLRAERAALLKHDGSEFECLVARGIAAADVREGNKGVSFGVVREAMRSGEPVLSDNALADARFMDRASVMATDIRSVLCSPIRTKDHTFGFLYLDRRLTGVPFSPEHLDLLAAFSTQVAVAWENAVSFEEIARLNEGLERKVSDRTVELRKKNDELQTTLDELTNTRLKLAEAERDALEKEMQLARDIQRSILPPEDTQRLSGLSVCGQVIPASYCGGDFWGYAALPDGRTLVIIADVTGHGMASSLITAVARSCLDTLREQEAIRSAADVLRTMNQVIFASAHGKLCATAFAGIFDPAARQLSFGNAGHNFPYLLREGADAAPLVAAGTRLGEAANTDFETHVREILPGDRLVLFTDGIIEWPNAKGKDYGDRRFRKSAQARRGEAPDECIRGLIDDATAYTDGIERDDDLTLVIVDVATE